MYIGPCQGKPAVLGIANSQEVRGSSKVTDQDPEGKFEALAQYARDLTQAAREGKLDPVIGRDEQIRHDFVIRHTPLHWP